MTPRNVGAAHSSSISNCACILRNIQRLYRTSRTEFHYPRTWNTCLWLGDSLASDWSSASLWQRGGGRLLPFAILGTLTKMSWHCSHASQWRKSTSHLRRIGLGLEWNTLAEGASLQNRFLSNIFYENFWVVRANAIRSASRFKNRIFQKRTLCRKDTKFEIYCLTGIDVNN
jgi:hypothetical protein